MAYQPRPLETAGLDLPEDVLQLSDQLAKHFHDVWALQRISEGWDYGPHRNDATKEHPCLVPYENLPPNEQAFDRSAALETLKAIVSLGFCIERRIDLSTV